MTEPVATVVMTAYRAESLVAAAITRIRSLTTTGTEIVLVDDGSDDGTLALMRAAASTDSRIQVIALPKNVGVGVARHAGFSAATGKYIWNVDVDDEWPSDALERMLGVAGADADVVLAAAIRRSSLGIERAIPAPHADELTGPGALGLLLSGAVTGHLWSKLVARRLLDESVYTRARVHSDLAMVASVLARAEVVRVEHATIYTYRETAESNIQSTRPRGDSLGIVGPEVRDAVMHAAPELAPQLLVFEQWAIVLSALRDAVRSDYDAGEHRERFRAARGQIRLAALPALVRSGRRRDATLLAIAWFIPPLFRALMRH